MPRALARLAVLLPLAALLAACETLSTWGRSETAASEQQRLDPVGMDIYLDPLQRLSEGDDVEQADVYHLASNAYDAAPTTTNRLRLALVLGTAGHASSDPERALQMLSELLAAPETLLPVERTLAEIHLYAVEQWLILEAENRRLHASATRDAREQAAATSRRIRSAQAEIARLRAELEEAQSKLDAVTSIERSIEQAGNDDRGQ